MASHGAVASWRRGICNLWFLCMVRRYTLMYISAYGHAYAKLTPSALPCLHVSFEGCIFCILFRILVG